MIDRILKNTHFIIQTNYHPQTPAYLRDEELLYLPLPTKFRLTTPTHPLPAIFLNDWISFDSSLPEINVRMLTMEIIRVYDRFFLKQFRVATWKNAIYVDFLHMNTISGAGEWVIVCEKWKCGGGGHLYRPPPITLTMQSALLPLEIHPRINTVAINTNFTLNSIVFLI